MRHSHSHSPSWRMNAHSSALILISKNNLAPNRGVADGIGRVTAAIGEGDKLWRQPGAANDAHEAPDNKDKGTDERL